MPQAELCQGLVGRAAAGGQRVAMIAFRNHFVTALSALSRRVRARVAPLGNQRLTRRTSHRVKLSANLLLSFWGLELSMHLLHVAWPEATFPAALGRIGYQLWAHPGSGGQLRLVSPAPSPPSPPAPQASPTQFPSSS